MKRNTYDDEWFSDKPKADNWDKRCFILRHLQEFFLKYWESINNDLKSIRYNLITFKPVTFL